MSSVPVGEMLNFLTSRGSLSYSIAVVIITASCLSIYSDTSYFVVIGASSF